MFLYCKWKGKRVDCNHYVKQMKTDTGFCCSINAIYLAENYIVPEDDKDKVNTNYNGCPYYSSASYYSTTPSYYWSAWSTTTTTTTTGPIKRRKRSHSSATPAPNASSTTGYYYYYGTTSYYDYCYNSYASAPDDGDSFIQR